jgi:hypothetical protein
MLVELQPEHVLQDRACGLTHLRRPAVVLEDVHWCSLGGLKLAASQLVQPLADGLASTVARLVRVVDERGQPLAVLAARAQLDKPSMHAPRAVAVDLARCSAC